ncbi:hypothetical protein ON010_g879 [Phytophthora cinnamomi]|nr:hypothetical protein ON010_g879 [Phytophthora cinnamomi]
MAPTLAALAFAGAVSLAVSSVDAHGTLIKPALTFTGTGYGGNFQSDIPMNSLTPPSGETFTNYPDYSKNAAAFARALESSEYKSLKEFMYSKQDMSKGRFNMPKTAECGFTDPTGRRRPTAAGHGGMVRWPNDPRRPLRNLVRRRGGHAVHGQLPYGVPLRQIPIGEGGAAASNNTAAIVAAAKKGPSSFASAKSKWRGGGVSLPIAEVQHNNFNLDSSLPATPLDDSRRALPLQYTIDA